MEPRRLTIGLVNIDQSSMTTDVLTQLLALRSDGWTFDAVVVDNGSHAEDIKRTSDWMAANAAGFSSVRLVISGKNRGAAGGRNLVLKLNSNDRILILDNDVILPGSSNWLERLWSLLDEDDSVGIAAGMLRFASCPDIVESGGIGLTAQGRVGYLHRGVPASEVPPIAVPVVASPAACWLMRRAMIDEIGYLPEEYHPGQYEDVDYCVRALQQGWKTVCDRGASILHHGHTTTSNLVEHPFGRTIVRHALQFRRRYQDVLPDLATLTEEDIYWGPVPRAEVES